MKEFVYTIRDENGIHARPAGLLIKKAGEFKSNITIHKGTKSADAKKIFSLMSLGAKKDDELRITVSGDDEDTAAAEILKFFQAAL